MARSRSKLAEDLLPIMHPLFNLREACKQIALLEDHLNNERKRCPDCIRKHFLMIEALFEEALSLDDSQKWGEHLDGKADEIRGLQERWIDGDDERDIAQKLRAVRKALTPLCFDLREMSSESRWASGRLHLASLIAEVYLGRGMAHTGS